MRTTYTRKLTGAKYDADNPHCRECDCAACLLHLNSGYAARPAKSATENPVCGCLMFGDPE